MKTSLVLAAATLMSLPALPAAAQGGAYYRATLSAAAVKSTLVTRDTVWRCTDTTCTAGKSGARDTVMCELVAQRAGALAAFSANGTAFDAEALGKCNARAK